ncbi:transposase, partial [Flammeovirga sp. EKP202]|nr:transposase [Flammeovirga sp. EKP202]
MNDDLLALFFPEGMLDYFEIEDYTNSSTELQIYLKEKDIPPVEYSHLNL